MALVAVAFGSAHLRLSARPLGRGGAPAPPRRPSGRPAHLPRCSSPTILRRAHLRRFSVARLNEYGIILIVLIAYSLCPFSTIVYSLQWSVSPTILRRATLDGEPSARDTRQLWRLKATRALSRTSLPSLTTAPSPARYPMSDGCSELRRAADSQRRMCREAAARSAQTLASPGGGPRFSPRSSLAPLPPKGGGPSAAPPALASATRAVKIP